MAATKFLCKATLLALSVLSILSLHGAEAQNNTTNNDIKPWGIAIIVLVSIILFLTLLSLCVMPFLMRGGCGFFSKD